MKGKSLDKEEERIGTMYFRLFLSGLGKLWQRLFGREFSRTGAPVVLVAVLLLLAPAVVWTLHVRGRFSKVKENIKQHVVPGAGLGKPSGLPGGIEAMVLKRSQPPSGNEPEFVSTTLFPGQGMRVFQITANLPGYGDLDLMDTASLKALTEGPLPAPHGSNSDYGALELPWGGGMSGVGTPFGTSIRAMWRGRSIEEPTDTSSNTMIAEGGNLRGTPADDHGISPNATGSRGNAMFRDLNWDDRWPSKTDVSVEIQLAPRTLDLTILARNSGDAPEPLGIGWNPRFTTSGDQQRIELKLPGGDVMEIDPSRMTPTGNVAHELSGIDHFRSGGALGSQGFDAAFFHLKPGIGESQPAVEIRNPVLGYGLRMTALSPTIREIRVSSPASYGYVALGFQTNFDDPFGKEWNDQGITVLEPGQLLEWKVRLEIFAVPKQ
jgi:hypothetical protein